MNLRPVQALRAKPASWPSPTLLRGERLLDPASRSAYSSFGATVAVAVVAIAIVRLRFGGLITVTVFASGAWLVISAWLLRRLGWPRTATAVEVTTLTYVQGVAYLILTYSCAALSPCPLADGALARADSFLGFDWRRAYDMIESHRWAIGPASTAYTSFDWQPLLVVPALAAAGLSRRAWQLLLATNWTLAATCILFILLPAAGAYPHAHLVASPTAAASPATWNAATALHLIRDEGARHISPDLITGLVTFPSFHAAAAVLFSWAVWPIRVLRWPVAFLNIAMAAAAVPIGGHYLVDVIGGVLIAYAAVWLSAGTSLRDHRAYSHSAVR